MRIFKFYPIFLILFCHIGDAFANIRAPWTIPGGLSSSLIFSSQDIVVNSEDLSFDCDEATHCTITAVYEVHSDVSHSVKLQFIFSNSLNSDLDIKISSNKSIRPASEITPIALNEYDLISPEEYQYQLKLRPYLEHKKANNIDGSAVSFVATFEPGLNKITLRYKQKYGEIERGHGYFSDGTMQKNFSYKLWPIRGWKRSKDFKINLSIKFNRKKPNWWQRNIGGFRDLSCFTSFPGNAQRSWYNSNQIEEEIAIISDIIPSDKIPDELYCEFSEK